MAEELKVYLDHLIERENLRYQRSDERVVEYTQSKHPYLRLDDLDSDRAETYRKPDFQRATWAWTPEECVELLESIINGQVIPSIIMWTSPNNGFNYILDGGHRISVVLAWLRDDWGESYAQHAPDEEQKEQILAAAKQVRQLVNAKIGHIQEYKNARAALMAEVNARRNPADNLDDLTFRRGLFYQSLRSGDVTFHILWVKGDFQTAERSFLKINKTGRQLSDWEKILVENRNSSFARAVMSISSVASAPHYWPHEVPASGNETNNLLVQVDEILANVQQLHGILFQPLYETPVTRLEQPFLPAATNDKPKYVAELLTITEGFRGQEPETFKLMAQDTASDPSQIIINGWRLTSNAVDIFNHLNGPSDDARSLALVPALYFYNESGRYVRSLLYGFIYWLFSKTNPDDVIERKRIFSVYRGAFERVLRTDKQEIIRKISRSTGSGPEVTLQTARYYQGLLDLLVKHHGAIEKDDFAADYEKLTRSLSSGESRRPVENSNTGRSRVFTEKQKSTVTLQILLDSTPTCAICGGLLNPSGNVQYDHIQMRRSGGPTLTENARLVHPFCNNERERIEAIRNGNRALTLPQFSDPDLPGGPKQLVLIPDEMY